MWYTRDQRARDREVLHSPDGVCFINPASTCGRLRVLPREVCAVSEGTGRGEIRVDRRAGVSRGRSRRKQARLVRHRKAERRGQRIGRTEKRPPKARTVIGEYRKERRGPKAGLRVAVPACWARSIRVQFWMEIHQLQSWVMEPPWYVIRMPGGVGGGLPRGTSLSRLAKEIICVLYDQTFG